MWDLSSDTSIVSPSAGTTTRFSKVNPCWYEYLPLSVVVHYLNVFSACRGPAETDAPLIIDANAGLARPIAFQGFKMVSWRHSLLRCDKGQPQRRDDGSGICRKQ